MVTNFFQSVNGFLPEFFFVISLLFLLFFYSCFNFYIVQAKAEETFFFRNKVICLRNSSFFSSFLICFFGFFLSCSLVENFGVFFFGICTFDDIFFIIRSFVCFFSSFFFLGSLFFFKKSFIQAFEYPILILLGIVSILFLLSAQDFIFVYLCLELQTLIFYVLAAFNRSSFYSAEAGIKYFIVGSFSSGLLLFGLTFVYGSTGVSCFEDFSRLFSVYYGSSYFDLSVLFGLFFIIVAFFFKVAAVPFHFWVLDIYEGSPLFSVFFFSSIPKLGVFTCFLRILFECFSVFSFFWGSFCLFLSVCSVFVGSLGAFYQKKIKRFLVYSSVVHTGFILIGIAVYSLEGSLSFFIYLPIYTISSLLFWLFFLVANRHIIFLRYLEEFKGFCFENRKLCGMVVLLLFSIAGVPPLAGFYAKLYIFFVGIKSYFFFTCFVFVLASIVSVFYYLRFIKILFFDGFYKNAFCYSRFFVIGLVQKEASFCFSLGMFFLMFLYFFPVGYYLLSYRIAFCLFI